MHRIDTSTATGDGRFTEGNPLVPTPATVVSADWLNSVQEEIVNTLSAAGIAPDKADDAQLLAAIRMLIGTAGRSRYAVCSTAAATAVKAVACADFTLATGARVTVRFTVTNTAANPTLDVNGTGAKPIQYRGAAIAAGTLAADRTYEFVYDGTYYQLVGDAGDPRERRLILLTAPLRVYVNGSTGNDATADGAADNPFKTIQTAINYVSNTFSFGPFDVTISVAAGTYNETLYMVPYITSTGEFHLEGSGQASTIVIGQDYNRLVVGTGNQREKVTVVCTSCQIYNYANIQFKGGPTPASNEYSACMELFAGVHSLSNVTFMLDSDALSGIHAAVRAGATLNIDSGNQFNASSTQTNRTSLQIRSGFCQIRGNNSASGAIGIVAYVGLNGSLDISDGTTMSGSVTGIRYQVFLNGAVYSHGGGANYFPGTVAGTTSSGGQYI